MLRHIRAKDAAAIEKTQYRLVALVPERFFFEADLDRKLRKNFVLHNLHRLLENSPRVAVLQPIVDQPDTSTLFDGQQRVVIHYPRNFVERVGTQAMLNLDWFTLACSAEAIRLVEADGTEIFIKDRFGQEEEVPEESPLVKAAASTTGW